MVQPEDDTQSLDVQHIDKGQKPGDILLFYRPQGITPRLISWFTRSPFYHVAIADEDLHTVEARPRGIVRRDLRKREGGHTFAVIRASESGGRAALQWATTQIGDKYDRLDILVIILEHVFKHLRLNYKAPGNQYSCAEFVATAFGKAGTSLIPERSAAELVPADFAPLLTSQGISSIDKRAKGANNG